MKKYELKKYKLNTQMFNVNIRGHIIINGNIKL